MQRPTVKKISLFYPVLLIIALISMASSGFISLTGEWEKISDESIFDMEALMKRVLDLNQKKQYKKALQILLSIADQQKDSLLSMLFVQTFSLFLEKEVKQGQEDIQKNKSNINAYIRMAGSLELLGDSFRAMEVLFNGINNLPKAIDLWMNIARLEFKANRKLEALAVFREVIRLDEKNSDAYNNAAHILAGLESKEDLKEAKKLAKNAHKLDPKNPKYLDTLAEIHFRQGDKRKAQTLMEQAIKLSPLSSTFKDRLKRFQDHNLLKAE
jgi:tetratricopeptide (TPR) repeat protein